MESYEMTMPSGKKVSKLDMAIPGQSLTKPKGEYPWEQPPTYTTQDEAMGYMMSTIGTVDNMARVLAALEEGITVREMVKAFVLAGFSEGKFNPNIAELIREDLVTFVKIIAEKAEIEYKEGSPRNQDFFYNSLSNLKNAKENNMPTTKNRKKELVDQLEEEEPIEPQEEKQGLMTRNNTDGLMARG